MPLEFKDCTGLSRSDSEIRQAIQQVTKEIVKADISNPALYMQFIVIKHGLDELLLLRAIIKKEGKLKCPRCLTSFISQKELDSHICDYAVVEPG